MKRLRAGRIAEGVNMATVAYCSASPGGRVPRWERRAEWIELCLACASMGAEQLSALVMQRARARSPHLGGALVVAYRIQGSGQAAGLIGLLLGFVVIYLSQRKARYHAWSLGCMVFCVIGFFLNSLSWSIA